MFRILYGLVTLQEIAFLLYFNHLIFDPIPYLDVEFPQIPLFLCIWGGVALFLICGYRCQFSSYANYLFWLVFVNFTPMQRDFDGGFDAFMIGAGFFLMFMPIDRRFAIDALIIKLKANQFAAALKSRTQVTVFAYYVPLAICLGFLYFDSAVHKLFAEHWRNGLGAWLPSTMPYYVSALDVSWLLNQEILQKTIGYSIFLFQFSFPFLFFRKRFRVLMLGMGAALHAGITLLLNIYPFGMGMLMFYVLMIPFYWWRSLRRVVSFREPRIVLHFADAYLPARRAAIILEHFDMLKSISFQADPVGSEIFSDSVSTVFKGLAVTDARRPGVQQVYSGLELYVKALTAMRYTALLAIFLKLPGVGHFCFGRRSETSGGANREVPSPFVAAIENLGSTTTLYDRCFVYSGSNVKRNISAKLYKLFIVFLLLQVNCTVHYGLIYRLQESEISTPVFKNLQAASNAMLMFSHTFLGITPHALYLHDHFQGYHDVLALTYRYDSGPEKWLPFVNAEGRLLAPNWGRVHSMWANIAVTPNINQQRLKKFIMKVTAYWGTKLGLDLNHTIFYIQHKTIDSPVTWVEDLRAKNLSGKWETIGAAKWQNNVILITLPQEIESSRL